MRAIIASSIASTSSKLLCLIIFSISHKSCRISSFFDGEIDDSSRRFRHMEMFFSTELKDPESRAFSSSVNIELKDAVVGVLD